MQNYTNFFDLQSKKHKNHKNDGDFVLFCVKVVANWRIFVTFAFENRRTETGKLKRKLKTTEMRRLKPDEN